MSLLTYSVHCFLFRQTVWRNSVCHIGMSQKLLLKIPAFKPLSSTCRCKEHYQSNKLIHEETFTRRPPIWDLTTISHKSDSLQKNDKYQEHIFADFYLLNSAYRFFFVFLINKNSPVCNSSHRDLPRRSNIEESDSAFFKLKPFG